MNSGLSLLDRAEREWCLSWTVPSDASGAVFTQNMTKHTAKQSENRKGDRTNAPWKQLSPVLLPPVSFIVFFLLFALVCISDQLKMLPRPRDPRDHCSSNCLFTVVRDICFFLTQSQALLTLPGMSCLSPGRIDRWIAWMCPHAVCLYCQQALWKIGGELCIVVQFPRPPFLAIMRFSRKFLSKITSVLRW